MIAVQTDSDAPVCEEHDSPRQETRLRRTSAHVREHGDAACCGPPRRVHQHAHHKRRCLDLVTGRLPEEYITGRYTRRFGGWWGPASCPVGARCMHASTGGGNKGGPSDTDEVIGSRVGVAGQAQTRTSTAAWLSSLLAGPSNPLQTVPPAGNARGGGECSFS